jgi:two-component system cell cycle response regulator DivK
MKTDPGVRTRRRVLVVEDNPVNLELARAILEELECEVVLASTGDAALRMLASVRPDLILMDVQLPGMDGYEATRAIKAMPAGAAIPVVVVTAHAMAHERALAHEAGCSAFLTKPIDVQLFKETIRCFLTAA